MQFSRICYTHLQNRGENEYRDTERDRETERESTQNAHKERSEMKLISHEKLDSGGEEYIFEDDQGVIVIRFLWNKTIVMFFEKEKENKESDQS